MKKNYDDIAFSMMLIFVFKIISNKWFIQDLNRYFFLSISFVLVSLFVGIFSEFNFLIFLAGIVFGMLFAFLFMFYRVFNDEIFKGKK